MKGHFDARKKFPQEVVEKFDATLDPQGLDQYGQLWTNAECGQAARFMHSVHTIVAMVMANPREAEKDLWQAFVESLQDPLIAFIALQRETANKRVTQEERQQKAVQRIAETREYFQSVIIRPFGLRDETMRKNVDKANARHVAYGIRYPETEQVYPHMLRSFKYVTLLFVARMQAALAKGGMMAEVIGGRAVERLFNAADVDLGAPVAPANTAEFLETHDQIIEESNSILERTDPSLHAGLQTASHTVAANALKATAARQRTSPEKLARSLRKKTRERLAV